MSDQNILSVFVDESGNFGDPDDSARYCIVTLVFHNQSAEITRFIKELNQANYDLGIDPETFQFHMGPLIRQEDEYAAMSRPMRGRILDRMMTFVRKVEFCNWEPGIRNSKPSLHTAISPKTAAYPLKIFIAANRVLFSYFQFISP